MTPSKPRRRRIAIALGDPAGIGAEVTLRALARGAPEGLEVTLVGCRRWLERSQRGLWERGIRDLADPATFQGLDLPLQEPIEPGRSSAAAGAASFAWLTAATRLVLDGTCDALVTAPIAKSSWHAAGHRYPGQTERLAELAGKLLANDTGDRIRCAGAESDHDADRPGRPRRRGRLGRSRPGCPRYRRQQERERDTGPMQRMCHGPPLCGWLPARASVPDGMPPSAGRGSIDSTGYPLASAASIGRFEVVHSVLRGVTCAQGEPAVVAQAARARWTIRD